MRKWLVVAVLALVPGLAQAQFACIPKTMLTPSADGTIRVEGRSAAGEWVYYWCPSTFAGRWLLQVNAVLKRYRNTVADPMALALSIIDAPDLLAAVNAAAAAAAVKPAPGSQEEFEHLTLLREACLAATNPPPELVPNVKMAASNCPAAPAPPVPAAPAWRTPAAGNTLYTAAGGRLTSKVTGRLAPANALCDCSSPIAVGSSTYCPLAGATTAEVTLCKRVAP